MFHSTVHLRSVLSPREWYTRHHKMLSSASDRQLRLTCTGWGGDMTCQAEFDMSRKGLTKEHLPRSCTPRWLKMTSATSRGSRTSKNGIVLISSCSQHRHTHLRYAQVRRGQLTKSAMRVSTKLLEPRPPTSSPRSAADALMLRALPPSAGNTSSGGGSLLAVLYSAARFLAGASALSSSESRVLFPSNRRGSRDNSRRHSHRKLSRSIVRSSSAISIPGTT